ncbi:MAG: DNA mismatch repair endonuclease MutL [Clostridioides sp.]|nr:DNA mismatch repair endonuclease MutL [Clostridioides sp.]
MKRINILDDKTINKIAAGEVVERPSSVVKELIENSIDACSKKITIEIKDGGKELIKISDNGEGIASSEIDKCFMRHATSKIKEASDLYHINSLGFRGEAMSSISAVSRVEMITKTKDELVGTKIIIEGGKIISKEAVGAPNGTTINICDLFFNTPARKKFLKSSHSETINISDLINKLAIANPDIQIKYISNSKTMVSTPGDSSQSNAIRNIYGKQVSENLIEIEYESRYFKLKGFISNNNLYRSNKNLQHIYINGRYVKNTMIYNAIFEAYKAIIPIGKHCVCFLSIEIDPEKLDVNVHPNKLEVKFEKEHEIYIELRDVIRDKLMSTSLIGKYQTFDKNKNDFFGNKDNYFRNQDNSIINKNSNEKSIENNVATNEERSNEEHIKATKNFVSFGEKLKAVEENIDSVSNDASKINSNYDSKDINQINSNYDFKDTSKANSNASTNKCISENDYDYDVKRNLLNNKINNQESDGYVINDLSNDNLKNKDCVNNALDNDNLKNKFNKNVSVGENIQLEVLDENIEIEDKRKINFSEYNYIGIIFKTYIVLSKGDSMFLLDQHAAHERVLFERYMNRFINNDIAMQMLLDPVILEFSNVDMLKIEKNLDIFNRYGFDVEIFGNNNIVIRAVPMMFGRPESEKFILEIIDHIDEIKNIYDLKTDRFAIMACRSAIKANDKIGDIEVSSLFEQLEDCDNPFTCPHGRPTVVEISKYEIEKMFKRVM